jgi:4-carboxymuconolactone decarboxylase
MAAMTQTERIAAYERVVRELGVGRIGTGPDAKSLPSRGGRGDARGSALPIESEILGIQMFEFGEIWGRPGLDLKTRSFISVAAHIALRVPDQLYRQINIALNLGITPEEIHEVLLHGATYGGFAAWDLAYGVANEVFVARGILEPGTGVEIAPVPAMDHAEREAARIRIVHTLGVGRVGAGADAPVLTALPGGPAFSGRADDLENEIAFITADYGYGEIWGRPGLPLRIRSFVTMSLLQTLRKNNQLHIHIGNALNIGITRDEVNEALAQTGIYIGGSGWHNGITVARHIFAQHPAAGGTPGSV